MLFLRGRAGTATVRRWTPVALEAAAVVVDVEFAELVVAAVGALWLLELPHAAGARADVTAIASLRTAKAEQTDLAIISRTRVPLPPPRTL